jgi:triosephosphate isomerase
MRKPLLAGNWKMNKTVSEATALAEQLAKIKIPDNREVMIAPNFLAMEAVKKALGNSKIAVGAQNAHFETKGAFTGETSVDMIKAAGFAYVILGHSERRALFAEDNALINKKVLAALGAEMTTLLCVGEVLSEREKGIQNDVVKEQILAGLTGVSEKSLAHLVIAYEPVWAIGTGKTASPEDAEEMHAFIRSLISSLYSKDSANALRVLYGGSVNEANIDSLMAKPNIDGALVGGASLKVESFSRIIAFV